MARVVEIVVRGRPRPLVLLRSVRRTCRRSTPDGRRVVEPSEVVDLPRDTCRVEQVEDAGIVEQSEPRDVVRRDAAGRSRGEVEVVRVGRPEHRAEVVHAQREVPVQAVVERQVGAGVVAHAVDAVRREEPVHPAAVPLGVDGRPEVADVARRAAREMKRRDGSARPVRLRVAGRHAVAPDEGGEAVVVVKRAVLLAGDDDRVDRRPPAGPGRVRPRQRGGCRQPRRPRERRAAPEQPPPRTAPLLAHRLPCTSVDTNRVRPRSFRGAGRAPRGSRRRSPPYRPSPAGPPPGRRRSGRSGRAGAAPGRRGTARP